jgi:RHS repeat-associated protein
VRSYTVTEAGQVVSMTIPAGEANAGTYLPTWNGHGDALALWRQNGDGTLTLANSYTYATWGTPATAVHNGIGDLGFRFLYVGAGDVQWDDFSGAGLLYMHARHYSPLTGRFLQPDPSAAEANLYAYAGNNPVTRVDPGGMYYGSSLAPNSLELRRCGQKPHECAVWAHASLQSFMVAFGYGHPKKNAMRHCVWQCLLTHRLGWWPAYEWGWRHERGSTSSFDSLADYHNNYVGRLLGQQLNEFYLPSQVRRAEILCNAAWNRGWLWYVKRLGTSPAVYWSDGRREWNPRSGPNRP